MIAYSARDLHLPLQNVGKSVFAGVRRFLRTGLTPLAPLSSRAREGEIPFFSPLHLGWGGDTVRRTEGRGVQLMVGQAWNPPNQNLPIQEGRYD
jgi:hypothetical protein